MTKYDEEGSLVEQPGENVPCKVCGRKDMPLHINGQCAACGPEDLPPSMKVIRLPCFGITIELGRWPSKEEPACGTITSYLQEDLTGDDKEYLAAIDALESLILAHACAGVDVTSLAYIEGIESAVAAIAHHYE